MRFGTSRPMRRSEILSSRVERMPMLSNGVITVSLLQESLKRNSKMNREKKMKRMRRLILQFMSCLQWPCVKTPTATRHPFSLMDFQSSPGHHIRTCSYTHRSHMERPCSLVCPSWRCQLVDFYMLTQSKIQLNSPCITILKVITWLSSTSRSKRRRRSSVLKFLRPKK